MLYARYKSSIVHSPDAYSARNSFRFSTTPLALHGMTTCTRLRERTKPVKHPPGLFCKVCPRFVPVRRARVQPCRNHSQVRRLQPLRYAFMLSIRQNVAQRAKGGFLLVLTQTL